MGVKQAKKNHIIAILPVCLLFDSYKNGKVLFPNSGAKTFS